MTFSVPLWLDVWQKSQNADNTPVLAVYSGGRLSIDLRERYNAEHSVKD